jgi:peptidoglycan hydrolase CwlO-like protein
MIINNDGTWTKKELKLWDEYFANQIKQINWSINHYQNLIKEEKKDLKKLQQKYKKFKEENK